MENVRNKPPTWFYILSVILLLWNIMGVYAFFGQVTMGSEHMAALSDAERTMYENVPWWATVAFALAVFGGPLGCVGLLCFGNVK